MKQTTRQRVEQAVEKFAERERYCVGSDILYREDVVKLILAERRRIRREVVRLKRINCDASPVGQCYAAAYDDVLNTLRG